jgi:hypothetical protein
MGINSTGKIRNINDGNRINIINPDFEPEVNASNDAKNIAVHARYRTFLSGWLINKNERKSDIGLK